MHAVNSAGRDVDRFVAALREHDGYLRGLVWAVVRDSDVIDDVMQAAYEQAYRSLGTFDGRSSMRTWLHTISYRRAVDHVRYESRRRTVPLDDNAAAGLRSTAAAIADHRLAAMEVVSLLDRLDSNERALLYLTAGLGYGYDEVAAIVDLPRGTVASRVSRAKDKLRKGPNW